jgi:phosphoribosylformylglycinamidine cyclo-ligase
MLDGPKNVRRGDVVIGIASSGLHTNGYSLARKILFDQLKLKPATRLAELGHSVGEELLKVHVSYGPLVQLLLKKFNSPTGRGNSRPVIRALAHITGGGFIDNIPRVLPKSCDVIIRKGTWDMLPIFRFLQEHGGVREEELYQVFNMGIGMIAIVSAPAAEAALKFIRARKHLSWVIGSVVAGSGKTRVV